MANGDAPAAAADIPHFDTRFVVQTPDGSTATQVLRTDRPLSTPELAAHVAQQGSTFVGYADMPPPAPPPPGAGAGEAPPLPSRVAPTSGVVPTLAPPAATLPPPAPAEAAPAATPTTAAQRVTGLLLPPRSFKSQLPSIAGATALGSVGGAVGAMTGPLAPVAIPVLSATGAAVGGGLGEAGDLLYEHLTGATPAEPGTGWQRIQNAAYRSAATEAIAGPVAYAVRPIVKAVMPAAEAAADLLPVLARNLPAEVKTVETTTPGVVRSIDRLLNPETASAVLSKANLSPEGQQTLFRAWWQRQAGKAPEQIADTWESLSGKAQQTLAGPHVEQMQTVVNTLKTGQDVPILSSVLGTGGGGALGTAGYLTGHPMLGTVGGVLTATRAAEQSVPYVASRMLQTPAGAGFLANLPRVAQVVAPRLTLPAVGEVPIPLARAGAQSLVAMPNAWPATSKLFGP
jgi:hypothetical protein